MRVVLVGDIHAFRRFVPPWLLVGKRILGVTTLWFHRQFVFDRRLLAPVLRQALTLKPDLMLLSGDLTTTSLPGEFLDVRHILDSELREVAALVIPGNHDRYTRRAQQQGALERHLGRYVPSGFPHFRHLRGRWHLLALDAAKPYFASAHGRLGAAQLAAIEPLVAPLTAQDGLIVLCHYPSVYPPGMHHRPGHALLDREELMGMLRRCPARTLYLHGHVHMPWQFTPSDAALGHVTFINAGSPTCRSRRYRFGQGFWQIELADDPSRPVELWKHLPQRDPVGLGGALADLPRQDCLWSVERVL